MYRSNVVGYPDKLVSSVVLCCVYSVTGEAEHVRLVPTGGRLHSSCYEVNPGTGSGDRTEGILVRNSLENL